LKYRPEIDGLRAVAVLPVVFFHAGFSLFGGGYAGVDVFFVISGFLITSIILDDLEKGTFSLGHFYMRRVRRILPALFIVMLACIPFVWFLFTPQHMKLFSESMIAAATFSSNILFWQQSGYFDSAAELKPLLHTWSLAVEEQYYIFFPLVLMLFWRTKKSLAVPALALALFISLGLAHWGAYNKPSASFYLLPTRGWELLFGALAAFYMRTNIPRTIPAIYNQILSLLGLLLIILCFFVYDDSTPFPSLFTLMPVVGSVLVIMFTTPASLAYKILSHKVAVGIGLISYSFYLWHQPLFAFAKYASPVHPSLWLMSALGFLSLGLAYLSWRYVEKPFRIHGKISHRTVLTLAACFTGVFILIGSFGHFTNGFEKLYLSIRLSPKQVETYSFVQYHTDYDLYEHMVDDGDCVFWHKSLTEDTLERINTCQDKYGPAVVVLGDSHAMNLHNIVAKSGVFPFIIGLSQGGCRPPESKPECQYNDFENFLERRPEVIKFVIFHQSGSYLLYDRYGNHDTSSIFDETGSYAVDIEGISRLGDYLSRLQEHTKVYWAGPFVEARVDLQSRNIVSQNRFLINENSLAIFKHLDDIIIDQLNKNNSYPPSRYISLVEWMGIEQGFLLQEDCLTYKDQDHFSRCGENILAERLKEKLQSIGQ
jgi:peptidoglycan/LPS O-acetylase OafA/YrhL